MEKQVLVLRGVSGSGKSTFVRTLPDPVVVSADHFYDRLGHYDATLIDDAQRECFQAFVLATDAARPLVVVDNTNLEAWNIAPYMAYGGLRGYVVRIVEFPLPSSDLEQSIQILAKRNLHGVPPKTIQFMIDRFNRGFIPKKWSRVSVQDFEL